MREEAQKFVSKTYNRLFKIRKQPLVNSIVAYELYFKHCIDTNSMPVSYLGFLEKEYPLKWRRVLIDLNKDSDTM